MRATIQHIREELRGVSTEQEISEYVKRIFHALYGWSFTDLMLHSDAKIPPAGKALISDIIGRLKKNEPIQYILGMCEFWGMELTVNRSVLIPRPETEELVDWIISSTKVSPASILDIGTGSGCIALALKKAFPPSKVTACDISEQALEVARLNGSNLDLDIRWLQADIRDVTPFHSDERFSLIVSNPPYVTETEKKRMNRNVLDFEPHTALFVPDADPLLFYRHIAEFSRERLMPEGSLFLEINEHFEEETVKLLDAAGFSKIEPRKDLQQKPRMIRAKS